MAPSHTANPRTALNWKEVIGTVLVVVGVNLAAMVCMVGFFFASYIVRESIPPTPEPWQRRKADPGMIQPVAPQPVKSDWRFETIYAPRNIRGTDLALDSHSRPHIAYGSDAIYYAWFDGSAWQHETAVLSTAWGEAQLVLDANDTPHIFYRMGQFESSSLEHAYRAAAGWQRETIDSHFCQNVLHDAVLEPGATLALLISGGLNCTGGDITTNHVWLMQQSAGGWRTTLVTESGVQPSLAYDRSGLAHIVYHNYGMGEIYEAAQANGKFTAAPLVKDLFDPSNPLVLFDTGGVEHILYKKHVQFSDDQGAYKDRFTLEHGWLAASGWQFDTVDAFSYEFYLLKAYADVQGRVNVLYHIGSRSVSLAQWGPNGWDIIPGKVDFPIQAVTGQSIVVDRGDRLHLVTVDGAGIAQYAVQQDAVQKDSGWQVTEIDRGSDLGFDRMALAFDRGGGLAAAFPSGDDLLHYLWQENGVWQEEAVGPFKGNHQDYPVELYFDAQNRPHILYTSFDSFNPGTLHAFRDQGRWETDAVPASVGNGEAPHRLVISPEGWPVFLAGPKSQIDELFWLVYRSPDGWHQDLPHARAWRGHLATPQIAYSPQQSAASTQSESGDITLPAMVFSMPETHEVAYFDPTTGKQVVLPVLDNKQDAGHYALDFDPQGKPVIFFSIMQYFQNNVYRPVNLNFLTETQTGWQAYQIDTGESREFTVPTHFLDRQGQAHFTTGLYIGTNLFYLTGAGPNWKITPIPDEGPNPALPYGRRLVGQALRAETGEFCAAFLDDAANELILGCLENIE